MQRKYVFFSCFARRVRAEGRCSSCEVTSCLAAGYCPHLPNPSYRVPAERPGPTQINFSLGLVELPGQISHPVVFLKRSAERGEPQTRKQTRKRKRTDISSFLLGVSTPLASTAIGVPDLLPTGRSFCCRRRLPLLLNQRHGRRVERRGRVQLTLDGIR